MIVRPAAPLPPAEVAAALGTRAAPCWLFSPGTADPATGPFQLIASDPVAVVRGDVLDDLMPAWAAARAAWRAGPGTPIAVGFFSYDLGRQFHRLGSTAPPPSGWPGLELRFYDAFFRHDDSGAQIVAVDDRAADALAARIGRAPGPPGFALGEFAPTEPAARHLAAIERVRAYIVAGDVYQVNLARRLEARLVADGPPGLALFARLVRVAPAPHALWLGDSTRALVGNSPERFLRLCGDRLETAPIKGTRPRGADPAADAALRAELTSDPKDHAEHVMIVDLERNDLGRISVTGSVAVAELLRVLTLPSVLHLESTVCGRLRPGVDFPEILRATFPGGSITGAPKRRAMQIIDELEPAQRGPYTGATGWLGAAGDFDLAVAIRTALLDGERLTLWVGGGIVADSSPAAELAETEVKARAFAALSAREVV